MRRGEVCAGRNPAGMRRAPLNGEGELSTGWEASGQLESRPEVWCGVVGRGNGGGGWRGGGWREKGDDGFIRRIDVEVEEEGSTSFDPLCGRGDSNLIWPDHPWPSAERISKERGKGGGRG
jgi:hypothetical protein